MVKQYNLTATFEAIQWTGDNLKEVLDFVGKHPKFDTWFPTWEDYEKHVMEEGLVFKIITPGNHGLCAYPSDYIVRTDLKWFQVYPEKDFYKKYKPVINDPKV